MCTTTLTHADLFEACSAGDTARALALLDGGAPYTAPDKGHEGWTCLMAAASAGDAELVRALCDRGAPIEASASFGWRAIHCAARAGREGAIRVLVELGADVDARTCDGWTACHQAASCSVGAAASVGGGARGGGAAGAPAAADAGGVVRALAAAGADVFATTNEGWTARFLAHCLGRADCATALTALEAEGRDRVRTAELAMPPPPPGSDLFSPRRDGRDDTASPAAEGWSSSPTAERAMAAVPTP